MMELFLTVFSATFFVTVIRTTTPLLLATMGGLVADLSGALNVALEGMMLIGCLTAVIVSVYAPWYVAVVAGLGAGALLGLLMAFFALRLKADIILVGFAINILATGGTVFALALATGGDKGTSINLPSKAIPAVDLSFLSGIPGIGPTVAAFVTHHITRWPLANSDAWVACTGLDPRPNESGARIGRRRLSKRGNASLRQMLYMAAMGLTRCKGGKPLYAAIHDRGHSSTASFNILARKLARIAWGVFKSGRDFDPSMLKVGQTCFQQA